MNKYFSFLNLALLSSVFSYADSNNPNGLNPKQINFSGSVSENMDRILHFYSTFIVPIMIVVTVVVFILLTVTLIKFRESKNPVPSKTTHNTTLEIIWTTIPAILLLVMAFPSIALIRYQEEIPQSDVVIKVVGNQWYWSYEYVNNPDIAFDSLMLSDSEAKSKNLPRLLAVDNPIVVPVNKNIRFNITANDVIHSFGILPMGVKMDAIPGRLNSTWVKPTKTGVFYGQCYELCGVNHAFMPIMIYVVSEEDYKAWLETYPSNKEKANEILSNYLTQS